MNCDLLHGFLGLPSDWDGASGGRAWNLWPKAFAKVGELTEACRGEIEGAEHRVAIGYGMGGRLLLELLREGVRFKRVVLISVNPGLADPVLREARRKSDEVWAEKFESGPWNHVVAEWNAQPIFKDTVTIPRAVTDFDRKMLAASLRNWSLGVTAPWAGAPAGVPVEWVYGAQDHYMANHAKKLAAQGEKVRVVEGAGHRVVWDRPELMRVLMKGVDDADAVDHNPTI